jgi:hypothetical protein
LRAQSDVFGALFMSTAGKRRADGPAVRGGRPKGGARKATTSQPTTTPSAATKPVKAVKASRPGRSAKAAAVPAGSGSTWVREDQRIALQAAVEALGETFVPSDWSFDQSSLLLTAARRVVPLGAGHDLLVISNECYTGWVAPGQDPVRVAEALAAAAPLASTQIEWILDGQVRFGVGPWLLRPIGRRGWVATRRTRTRAVWHFVVDAAGNFTPVHSDERAVVDGALVALAQVHSSTTS